MILTSSTITFNIHLVGNQNTFFLQTFTVTMFIWYVINVQIVNNRIKTIDSIMMMNIFKFTSNFNKSSV